MDERTSGQATSPDARLVAYELQLARGELLEAARLVHLAVEAEREHRAPRLRRARQDTRKALYLLDRSVRALKREGGEAGEETAA